MTLLSICIPSHRDLKTSRIPLESALAYAETAGARVIISDNSRDPEKKRFLAGRAPHLVYLEGPDDALQNWMNVLAHVDTPFLLPMGDDDEVYFLDDEDSVDLATLPDDVAGVRPQTQIWTVSGGVRRTERFTINAGTPDARVLEYNGKAEGNNSIYYSIFRASLYLPLIRLFAKAHPTRGGYCDWSLCLSLFSAGRMLYDPSLIYRYDLGRWAQTDTLSQSKLSLYEQAGLPVDTDKYWALLIFLDMFVFTLRASSPLSPDERQKVLIAICQIALAPFLRQVQEKPYDYDETLHYLAELLGQETDIHGMFQLAVMMADCIQPGLKDRYVKFFQAALNG